MKQLEELQDGCTKINWKQETLDYAGKVHDKIRWLLQRMNLDLPNLSVAYVLDDMDGFYFEVGLTPYSLVMYSPKFEREEADGPWVIYRIRDEHDEVGNWDYEKVESFKSEDGFVRAYVSYVVSDAVDQLEIPEGVAAQARTYAFFEDDQRSLWIREQNVPLKDEVTV